MPAAADRDAGFRRERGTHEAQRFRALGEIGEHVDLRQRGAGRLQRRDRRRERVQQLVVQELLARERALLRRQRAVLERLQFRRDVALRVLERLAAPVVVGNLLDVRVRHLDVEAVHAVVLDLEARDAGARALARLECHEELAAVRVDRAQLVEVGVVAGGDHAAFADQRRGLRHDRARQQRVPLRVHGERGARVGEERHGLDPPQQRRDLRELRERVAQSRKLARAHVAQRDASDHALHVDGALQCVRERARGARIGTERVDAVVPLGEPRLRPQRLRQPIPQQPAAGRRRARVEQRVQRRRVVAVERDGDLQVAARRRVERHEGAPGLDGQRAHVRQRRLLRRARVVQQRAGRADGERNVVGAEPREVQRAELAGHRLLRGLAVELPRGQRPARRRASAQRRGIGVVRHQELRGNDALEHARRVRQRDLGQRERARREVEPRDARALAGRDVGGEQAVALGLQQVRVGERARRHDARDLALDRTLARRRVAELFDDHDGLALLHEPRQVRFERVVRHARHRNRRAGGLPARGQRDVEQPRGPLGVVVEELVEVAHPVEHELVRMLRLDAQVLLHHRRVGGERAFRTGRGGDRRVGTHSPIIAAGPRRAVTPVSIR